MSTHLILVVLGLAMTVVALPMRRDRRAVINCDPPEDLDTLFQNLNQNINASMYLQLAGHQGKQSGHLAYELNTHLVNVSIADKDCPSAASTDPDSEIMESSTCPWWYNTTSLGEGFYPSVIPQAICKCSACIGNTANECVKINTYIRVLKMTGCQDGFLKYEPVLMKHDVGCTCAVKSVAAAPSGCGAFGCF